MPILSSATDAYSKTGEFKALENLLGKPAGQVLSIEGISQSSFPIVASALFNRLGGQLVIVTENSQKINEFQLDLSCFIDESLIYTLPPWDTLPYEYVSATEKTGRERITALYRLISGKPAVIITSVESLIRRLPGRDFLMKRGMEIITGEEYPFDDLLSLLVSYSYTREGRVEAFGQFAVKGGIIDIFLPSRDNPVRLDFFGDTLESIREFDAETQVSQSPLPSLTIFPRRELLLFQKEKNALIDRLKIEMEKGSGFPDEIASQLSRGEITGIPGIEDIFPLVIRPDNLESYFGEKTRVVFLEAAELMAKKSAVEKIFTELYRKKKNDTLCLPPDTLLDAGSFDRIGDNAIRLQTFTTSRDSLQWQLKSIQNFHGKITRLREEIANRLSDGWKLVITTGFEGQARRLFDLLSEFSPSSDFEKADMSSPLSIIVCSLKEGVEIHESRIMIITDHEIFGKSYRKKRQFKRKTSRPIDTFLDLKPGDFVVHLNHGIGIFSKIERMKAGGVERDFLMIEYADSDRLYVSLDQITMIQKYIGFEGKKPRLDYLGKKSAWNRIKDRVRESIEEIAKELVKIYSARSTMKGFQHPPDTQWQEEFESKFEFEETPDQITAIEDVKDDMESPKPMDRLVCGDVGFGKTEVAIRAAFKSVMAGRQVAILVPTTVLAMQHYSTFKKRFADYPITIEMLSRFRTQGEVKKIKEKLSKGEIDIIIGTHALLSKDVSIKNLGLLVIDEEQRFGVRHKEQLKKMRALVDVLTLTATPIPRTLHMALAGIRDLSTITTPPENRQSIETYVLEDNPDILRMAIINEIERNGQVFYVHNRVQTIEAQSSLLKKLVPEASICVAHGQMHEHELEDVMIDFMNEKYNVMSSTTIIESGLDMPNVNTIIINRADTFGLSQLYQLKGRVGRSVTKAYAYLFYPRHMPLTEEAQKRLQVISEYSDLGSGFKIAMKDLEIRGAGNILGREQSGDIMEVGFELYVQMLEDAVKNLKGEKPAMIFRTPVFLKSNFYIPDGYISDERQKIEFYKRFESCETISEIDDLEKEMRDRFGNYPDEVSVLVELERIRTVASSLLIEEILEDSRAIRIKMSGETRINMQKLIKNIQTDKRISLDTSDKSTLIFKPLAREGEKKLQEIKKWLQLFI